VLTHTEAAWRCTRPIGLRGPRSGQPGAVQTIASRGGRADWRYGSSRAPARVKTSRASRISPCAVFDGAGELVANATTHPTCIWARWGPASPACWRRCAAATIQRCGPAMDQLLANHPATGGTHLPDLTVIHHRCSQRDGNGGGGPKKMAIANGNEQPFSNSLDFLPGLSRPPRPMWAGSPQVRLPPFKAQTLGAGGLLARQCAAVAARANSWPYDWRRRLAAGPWPVRKSRAAPGRPAGPVAPTSLGAGLLQALAEARGAGGGAAG